MASALVRRLERLSFDGMDAASARATVRLLIETVESGELPRDAAFAPLRAAASRAAIDGAPLAEVLHAAQQFAEPALRARSGADATPKRAQNGEGDPAEAILRFAVAVGRVVSGSYLEERLRVAAAVQTAEWALVDAFLAGRPTGEAASRAGRRLAAAYGVLLVQGAVAREHVRAFEAAIAGLGEGEALWRLTANGANVLVPVAADVAEAWLAGADDLLAELAAAAGGASLVATVAWGAGADGVARAGDDAVQVLRLVTNTGRPPGLYRLDDVLLEAALSGTSPGPAARLAAILAPLDTAGPELLGTLEAYLANDADRRRTAAALHVHPNTLDYRLRRIGELTARSPSTARGLQVLGAALTLRRVTKTVSTRYS
jgi:hypothetical protein